MVNAEAEAEAEAVDFEPEVDDLMDEDVGDAAASSPNRAGAAANIPRLKSAITGGGSSSAPKKTKGRGFRDEAAAEAERNTRMSARFDSLDSDGGPGPKRFFGTRKVLVIDELEALNCSTSFIILKNKSHKKFNLCPSYSGHTEDCSFHPITVTVYQLIMDSKVEQ